MRVYEKDGITLLNGDCMDYMATLKDKEFELAIVDPPYNLGQKIVSGGFRGSKFESGYNVDWDELPDEKYFVELFRVSVNQIIWGGNYFVLPTTRCNLIWDKVQEFSGSDFELAWTSFDLPSKAFRMSRVEAYSLGKIHICQKPIALYRWLLQNYAKQGDKILDTHGGSFSSAIACWELGFTFVGIEKDEEYFEKAVQRFENHVKQGRLFTPEKKYEPIQETLIL